MCCCEGFETPKKMMLCYINGSILQKLDEISPHETFVVIARTLSQ
jgi:hypothetical protein